jgi:nucleoside-diphosphate-sugar epimerase
MSPSSNGRRRLVLAGATGVIGVQLMPLLAERGFDVIGLTRSPEKAPRVESLGAEPRVCDVFDRARLIEIVSAAQPEVVMHQLTDLPDELDRLPEHMGQNNRIRREGTRNLLDAAAAAGAQRFLAQSIAWQLPGDGGAAVHEHEQMVLGAGGVVLRYGQFYGPGTYHPGEGERPKRPPMVHVADAARRTVSLIDAPSGIVEIVD